MFHKTYKTAGINTKSNHIIDNHDTNTITTMLTCEKSRARFDFSDFFAESGLRDFSITTLVTSHTSRWLLLDKYYTTLHIKILATQSKTWI